MVISVNIFEQCMERLHSTTGQKCLISCFKNGLSGTNYLCTSLVLRPRPAFRRLQYGKVTESWAGPGNEATCVLYTKSTLDSNY